MRTKLFLITAAFWLFSCVKSTNQPFLNQEEKRLAMKAAKEKLIVALAGITSMSKDFRTVVENECLKQENGDYEVRLEKLIEIDNKMNLLQTSFRYTIKQVYDEMKRIDPIKIPIIYVPVMESRDKSIKDFPKINQIEQTIKSTADNSVLQKIKSYDLKESQIIFVDQNGDAFKNIESNNNKSSIQNNSGRDGGCEAPLFYPGYITDNNGYIEYLDCIGETYANYYDVWIVGFEENIEGDNNFPYNGGYSSNSSFSTSTRMKSNNVGRNGNPEYGALFRVTNLGAIEPWTMGKVELKYAVYDASGAKIKERAFGKISRSRVRGQQWVYLYDLIVNSWTLSSYGDKMFERWIEEDGGNDAPINISYTVNGINFSYQLKDEDDDLGMATVSFYDIPDIIPYLPTFITVYSITNLDFKRTIYPPQ